MYLTGFIGANLPCLSYKIGEKKTDIFCFKLGAQATVNLFEFLLIPTRLKSQYGFILLYCKVRMIFNLKYGKIAKRLNKSFTCT